MSQTTVTIPSGAARNMKKWADAAKMYRQERDSAHSELKMAYMTIERKDTLISVMYNMNVKCKESMIAADSINIIKQWELARVTENMNYYRKDAAYERRQKKVWQFTTALAIVVAFAVAIIK